MSADTSAGPMMLSGNSRSSDEYWIETTDPAADNPLYLELDGWEGPLDLLLDLARRQKVDLRSISILALVDQYLDYIERAEALRLELAADYLVMAAWLAYLKSAMLLPKEEQEDPSPEELALRLQLRLQRLGAMRESAARLLARDRVELADGHLLGHRPGSGAMSSCGARPKACARTARRFGPATGIRWCRPMARSRRVPHPRSTWCANGQ